MKNMEKAPNEKMLTGFVWAYVIMTVLYYVVLFFANDLLLLFTFLGGHINYYAFLGTLVFSEVWPQLHRAAAWLMVAVEVTYPIALLVCSLLALVRGRYQPFGILAVICHGLSMGILLPCMVRADGFWWLDAGMWFDLIGNTVFCVLFLRYVRKLPAANHKPSLGTVDSSSVL